MSDSLSVAFWDRCRGGPCHECTRIWPEHPAGLSLLVRHSRIHLLAASNRLKNLKKADAKKKINMMKHI